MPIIIVGTEKKGSLVNILLIALLIVLMAVATYFVFFSQAPYIDNFSSTEFKRATQIQAINFDTAAILDSPVRKLLGVKVNLPPPGDFGRDNPFMPIVETPPAGMTTTTTTTTTSPAPAR